MKKIILIFDGLDNVGKSTQIKKIRQWLNNKAFVITNLDAPIGEDNLKKISYGSKNIENFFKIWTLGWKNNIPLISDRGHFSEYAYRMFRDSDKIDDILEMEKKYSEIISDTIIFNFIDNANNIAQRDDGLSQYQAEEVDKIQKLIDRFKFISEKSIFENYLIDINAKDENEVFKIIKEKIQTKFKF